LNVLRPAFLPTNPSIGHSTNTADYVPLPACGGGKFTVSTVLDPASSLQFLSPTGEPCPAAAVVVPVYLFTPYFIFSIFLIPSLTVEQAVTCVIMFFLVCDLGHDVLVEFFCCMDVGCDRDLAGERFDMIFHGHAVLC